MSTQPEYFFHTPHPRSSHDHRHPRPHPIARRRRRQRGVGLLEALIAFLVLSLGMLGIARLHGTMRLGSEVARQRSEAVRLAQEEIEFLRAFAELEVVPGARSFEAIASAIRTVAAGAGYAASTAYLVTRRIDSAGSPRAKAAHIEVHWTDRHGSAQQVVLDTVIAGVAPAYSGALGLAHPAMPSHGPQGRSLRVPLAAKDLGDGRSAFKPIDNGTVALLFDNLSGLLVGRCTGVAAGTPTRGLDAGNLGTCDTHVGHLLSGVVRFSSATPPQAAHANDAPLAFSMSMAMSGGTYPNAPVCSVEAIVTAAGDRFAAWHCAVYPLPNGRWSGRANLLPSGWTVGDTSADKRVCRFTADLDGSGAIDANVEHPAAWVDVDAGLANQNFLVINGGESCPTGHAARVAGNNGDIYADLSTLPHQP